MANTKEMMAEIQGNMVKLGKKHPKLTKTFMQELVPATTSDGALDHKTKELIALGIAIAGKCEPCIGMHLMKCLKAGVTAEEIAEVCGVSVLMGGGPALMYSAKTMGMLEDLTS
ncbi:carboxymuconolactone decarboxylase family protein [Verrucomicrobiota bacterium]